MVIDTDNLRSAIDAREEQLLQQRYNGDWKKCPMVFLNASEKRVIDRKKLVDEIEFLVTGLLSVGIDPTKYHK